MELFLYQCLVACTLFVASLQQFHFNIVPTGNRLIDNYVIESIANVTIHHCVRSCMSLEKCKSFSFDRATDVCKLNDIDSSSAGNGDWLDDVNVDFADIGSFPKEIGGTCGTNPCDAQKRCVSSSPAGCIGYCGDPPAKSNSAILVLNMPNFVTSTREYACPATHNMTPYGDDGIYRVVCQPDGTWSEMLSSCVPI